MGHAGPGHELGAGAPLLEIEGLSKAFDGRPVLRDVHLYVRPGEITALVAGNGEGKSTLLDLVAGVLDPDSGRIRVAGRDIGEERADRRGIFYVPQSVKRYFAMKHPDLFCFLPGVSVRENVLGNVDGNPYAAALVADERLARFGLADVADAMPAELSVGMQQRLALARALSTDHPVLLLDEPLASVDRVTRLRLLSELTCEAAGRAVVYVTHDPTEVEALGALPMTLRDGVLYDPSGVRTGRAPSPSRQSPAGLAPAARGGDRQTGPRLAFGSATAAMGVQPPAERSRAAAEPQSADPDGWDEPEDARGAWGSAARERPAPSATAWPGAGAAAPPAGHGAVRLGAAPHGAAFRSPPQRSGAPAEPAGIPLATVVPGAPRTWSKASPPPAVPGQGAVPLDISVPASPAPPGVARPARPRNDPSPPVRRAGLARREPSPSPRYADPPDEPRAARSSAPARREPSPSPRYADPPDEPRAVEPAPRNPGPARGEPSPSPRYADPPVAAPAAHEPAPSPSQAALAPQPSSAPLLRPSVPGNGGGHPIVADAIPGASRLSLPAPHKALRTLVYGVASSAIRGVLRPAGGLPGLLQLLEDLASSLEEEASRLRRR